MLGFALSGRAASGKSALAGFLLAELALHGREGRIVAFADALKADVWDRYGLRKSDPGGREKLIEYGDGRRSDDRDYWVARLAPTVADLIRQDIVVIVDDLRFPREKEWCEAILLASVRVNSPLAQRIKRLRERGADPQFAHSMTPSECALEWADHDYYVENLRGPEWLHMMARALTLGAVQGQTAPVV